MRLRSSPEAPAPACRTSRKATRHPMSVFRAAQLPHSGGNYHTAVSLADNAMMRSGTLETPAITQCPRVCGASCEMNLKRMCGHCQIMSETTQQQTSRAQQHMCCWLLDMALWCVSQHQNSHTMASSTLAPNPPRPAARLKHVHIMTCATAWREQSEVSLFGRTWTGPCIAATLMFSPQCAGQSGYSSLKYGQTDALHTNGPLSSPGRGPLMLLVGSHTCTPLSDLTEWPPACQRGGHLGQLP